MCQKTETAQPTFPPISQMTLEEMRADLRAGEMPMDRAGDLLLEVARPLPAFLRGINPDRSDLIRLTPDDEDCRRADPEDYRKHLPQETFAQLGTALELAQKAARESLDLVVSDDLPHELSGAALEIHALLTTCCLALLGLKEGTGAVPSFSETIGEPTAFVAICDAAEMAYGVAWTARYGDRGAGPIHQTDGEMAEGD